LLFRLIPSPETEIETYVVGYFGHLFNESERRARKHLASEWYLMRYEEMLSRGTHMSEREVRTYPSA
jgi:hypothetical protein